MKIKVYLNDWFYNAGIVGFLRILEDNEDEFAIRKNNYIEFDTPSDEFVRFVLNDIYTGKKNKNMVEKFKPMVRKAFSAFINDIVNQKLNEVFDTM